MNGRWLCGWFAMCVMLLVGCRSADPLAMVFRPPVVGEATAGLPDHNRPAPVVEPATAIQLASHQTEADDNHGQEVQILQQPETVLEPVGMPENAEALQLDDVLFSVAECFPLIVVAIGEVEAAEGKITSAWGGFDTVVGAHSISQPLGFYQTFRNGASIEKPLWQGGHVYGSYRIGRGNFEPWYGERETNDSGEFRAGMSVPLIKDRNIDSRRVELQKAAGNRDAVNAGANARLLQFQRFATQAYWDWVAAGKVVGIQEQLLELALQRVEQIDQRIQAGDLAEIARIDNDRFIADRRNTLIQARRGFEKAAIKLSLFLRDTNCDPIIAGADKLPTEVPESTLISQKQLLVDIDEALLIRPEVAELTAERAQVCVDLRYAQNLTLPKLDVKGFASQDIGPSASSLGDKTPFEMQVGLLGEVPIQRRVGAGKIRTAQGKLTQIDARVRFLSDKIRSELQDAASAVNAAFEQIEQSSENVRLARRSLELGRKSFEAGDIDLIALNIYETAAADAELKLLNAVLKYFFFRAVYDTARSGRGFE